MAHLFFDMMAYACGVRETPHTQITESRTSFVVLCVDVSLFVG